MVNDTPSRTLATDLRPFRGDRAVVRENVAGRPGRWTTAARIRPARSRSRSPDQRPTIGPSRTTTSPRTTPATDTRPENTTTSLTDCPRGTMTRPNRTTWLPALTRDAPGDGDGDAASATAGTHERTQRDGGRDDDRPPLGTPTRPVHRPRAASYRRPPIVGFAGTVAR